MRRLAVIDPTGNDGGGTRFVRALLPALLRARPDLAIAFFANGSSLRRDAMTAELSRAGVEIRALEWVSDRPWKSRPLARRLAFKIQRSFGRHGSDLGSSVEELLRREIDMSLSGFDLAYCSWPFSTPIPTVDIPLAATIHDLNFKYFFGSPNFDARRTEILDRRIGDWLVRATAVASSRFMADEIGRFYPIAAPATVIRVTTFADTDAVTSKDTATLIADFDIRAPYMLCPTHLSNHKNLGTLFAAQSLLHERFPGLRLVLTGLGTETATGRAEYIGSARDTTEPDVIGLGYVSNAQIDALIENAAVVVNPSFYEAGNGPGVDAWNRGTPVAMSDIPPFREHLEYLGVEAALFDPRDPKDIAAKIADILDHPDAWRAAAARSKAAIARRTWDDVAREYLEVFDAAFSEHARG